MKMFFFGGDGDGDAIWMRCVSPLEARSPGDMLEEWQ